MVGLSDRDAALMHFQALLQEVRPKLALLRQMAEVYGFSLDEIGLSESSPRGITLADAVDLILCEQRDNGTPQLTAREISQEIHRRALTRAQAEPSNVRNALCRYAPTYGWLKQRAGSGDGVWEKGPRVLPGRILTSSKRALRKSGTPDEQGAQHG